MPKQYGLTPHDALRFLTAVDHDRSVGCQTDAKPRADFTVGGNRPLRLKVVSSLPERLINNQGS